MFDGPGFELTYDNGDQVTYVMSVFRCVITGEPTPDGREIHQSLYVAQDEWQSLHVSDWTYRVLPQVFEWENSDDRTAKFAAPSCS